MSAEELKLLENMKNDDKTCVILEETEHQNKKYSAMILGLYLLASDWSLCQKLCPTSVK
jgi:hypothetical protein